MASLSFIGSIVDPLSLMPVVPPYQPPPPPTMPAAACCCGLLKRSVAVARPLDCWLIAGKKTKQDGFGIVNAAAVTLSHVLGLHPWLVQTFGYTVAQCLPTMLATTYR